MRMLPKSVRLSTALFLIVHGTALNLSPAFAGLAPSRLSGETSIASTRDADLVLVRRALEHRLVAQKLRDYGVARAQVESRLAELSDRDLHDLASVSKGRPPGGAVSGLPWRGRARTRCGRCSGRAFPPCCSTIEEGARWCGATTACSWAGIRREESTCCTMVEPCRDASAGMS